MPKVIYVTHDGERYEVDADDGATLMQTAVDNDVPGIVGECGGACACATCHVHVDPAWQGALEPADEMERELLLGAIDPDEHSRLACQIPLTEALDGLTVRLPAMQI